MREPGKEGWLDVKFSYSTLVEILMHEEKIHAIVDAVELTHVVLCRFKLSCFPNRSTQSSHRSFHEYVAVLGLHVIVILAFVL